MLVEFTRHGKTYQCSMAVPLHEPPPSTLKIAFQPCVLKPPFELELAHQGTDDIRRVELYKPVREVQT
jgi:hypothetical protein